MSPQIQYLHTKMKARVECEMGFALPPITLEIYNVFLIAILLYKLHPV